MVFKQKRKNANSLSVCIAVVRKTLLFFFSFFQKQTQNEYMTSNYSICIHYSVVNSNSLFDPSLRHEEAAEAA